MAKRRNGGRTSYGYYDDYGEWKRPLAIFIAVILALGVAATVFCWGARDEDGHWAANPVITEWFDHWGKGAPVDEYETQETVITQNNGLFILTTRNAAAAPVALYSAQAQASTNTATITAQLTPADADYSAVNWTCSDSAVQLTPDEENPLNVQVSLVASLFVPATITCEVVSVTTLTATCKVDYMHFPEQITVSAGNIRFGAENNIDVSSVNEDMSGTITDFQCVIRSGEIQLTTETVTAISNRLGVSNGWDMSGGTLSNGNLILPATPHAAFVDSDEISVEDFRKAFFAVCNGKNNCAELDVVVDLVYNGKTYKTYEARCDVGFDGSTYGVAANGVQIGGGVILTD